jgi:hypothetical protein
MSTITVNDRVYSIRKTYEAALGIVICFIEMQDSGEQYTMMLTPDGDWKFTGSHAAELKPIEANISNAIKTLTEFSICYS